MPCDCSLCIRRSITYKTQCPTCFVAATEGDMINNRNLSEIIPKFLLIRHRLLKILLDYNSTGKSSTNTHTDHGRPEPIQHTHVPVSTTEPRSNKTDSRVNTSSFFQSKLKGGQVPPVGITTKKNVFGKTTLSKRHSRLKGVDKPKWYSESDDSDPAESDSNTDVIYCSSDESLDSSNDDFQVKTPNIKKGNRLKSPTNHSAKNAPMSKTEKTFTDANANSQSNNPNNNLRLFSQMQSSPSTSVRTGSAGYDGRPASWLCPSPTPTGSLQNSAKSPPFEVPSTSNIADTSSEKPGQTLARVPCPVCGVEVSSKHINLHLDRCLSNKDRRVETRAAPRRKQMSKLVYNLLTDKELKKKCLAAGLNNQGDRTTLSKRHHDFTLLYNSQCDSANPMSAMEVAREVERGEIARKKELKTKGTAATNKLVIQKGASADQVASAQKEYAKQHKSQFAQLIAEARERRMKKQADKAVQDNLLPSGTITSGDSQIDAASEISVPSIPAVDATSGSDVTAQISAESVASTSGETLCDTALPSPPSVSFNKLKCSGTPPAVQSLACDAPKNSPKSDTTLRQQEMDKADAEFNLMDDDPISDAMLSQLDMSIPDDIAHGSTVVEEKMDQCLDSTTLHPEEDADATLPLEDEDDHVEDHVEEGDELCWAVASDNDMFDDSPRSPSLIADTHMTSTDQAFVTEETVVTGELPTTEPVTTEGTSQSQTADTNKTSQPVVLTEVEPKEHCETTKPDEIRKRGRRKKDSRIKSRARTKCSGRVVESMAPVTIDPADRCEVTEDAASHSLSKPVIAASSLSAQSHVNCTIPQPSLEENDPNISSDGPRPRHSLRGRSKRKLSPKSDKVVASPAGKRLRRPRCSRRPMVTEAAVETSHGQSAELHMLSNADVDRGQDNR